MGEYADYILNGDDCDQCGEHIGDGPGYPRSCAGCGGASEKPQSKKASKNKRNRHNLQRNRRLRLKENDLTGWRQCNEYHFQKTIEGKIVNLYPTRRKFVVDNQTYHYSGNPDKCAQVLVDNLRIKENAK